eukprot:824579_1
MPSRTKGRKRRRTENDPNDVETDDTNTSAASNEQKIDDAPNDTHVHQPRHQPNEKEITINLCISAHEKDDKYCVVKADTMHKFAHYLESKRFDCSVFGETVSLSDIISRVKISENEEKYSVQSIVFKGKRFETPSVFKRTNTVADRQWFANQSKVHGDRIQTTAKRNGSDWCLLGSDTKTKVALKEKGGTIKNNGCNIWLSNEFDTNDAELKDKFHAIWNHWNEISNVMEQRMRSEPKKCATSIAKQQHDLIKQHKNGEITSEEYIERQAALTSKLYQGLKAAEDD